MPLIALAKSSPSQKHGEKGCLWFVLEGLMKSELWAFALEFGCILEARSSVLVQSLPL